MADQLGLFQDISESLPPPDQGTPVLTPLPELQDGQKKWKSLLHDELESDYYLKLKNFIKSERAQGKIIYPQDQEIFSSLHYTPLDQVKVVILGQDPYHGPNQAHGLCFSVKPGIPAPPSLKNIFLEIKNDLDIAPPNHGCLINWAKQGVLLLNAVLTVEKSKAGSHANMGWELFTDKIVSIVNEHCSGVVFLLWGSYAQKKGAIIDRLKHHVLTAAHPSPFSAHKGFLGCKHFSEANRLLSEQGKSAINWRL